MAELEQKLMEGAASLDRGDGVEGDESFKRVRQRTKARKPRE